MTETTIYAKFTTTTKVSLEPLDNMKFTIGLFSIALVFPRILIAQPLDISFQDAIRAVEDRNYEELREIITTTPDVLNHSIEDDCSLICEFTHLIRAPVNEEAITRIDFEAIGILLDSGADPEFSPDSLNRILGLANDFRGDIPEFPVNSGECTAGRNSSFPLANRLIDADTNLHVKVSTSLGTTYSTGFFYTYQLCLMPFVCSASYEEATPTIAGKLASVITDFERALISRLVSENTLNENCVSAILD